MSSRRPLLALALVSALVVPAVAFGAVRRVGQWPAQDAKVTIDLSAGTVSEALGSLGESAGWNLVLDLPEEASRAGNLQLHVKEANATDVLDAILAKGSWVADRKGDLVTVRADAAPALAVPSIPAVPPVPAVPAIPASTEDRTVMGGKLRIEKGEVVKNVTVMGGKVDVYGTVLGDVAVFGGKVRLHAGARVHRDVSATGGTIDVGKGARVDGKAVVLGGIVRRHPQSIVGSAEGNDGGNVDLKFEISDDDDDEPKGTLAARAGDAISGGLTRAALLFVLGTIFLSLFPARAAALREEVLRRPMRSLALGVVGCLAAAVILIALCVTVIGIPVALLLAPLLFLATCSGLAVVLEAVGGLTIGHRTKSPYAHLAAGALVLLLVGWIPVVGKLAVAAVILVAIGSIVATRGAGLLVRKPAAV
jgi:hypothetical protein